LLPCIKYVARQFGYAETFEQRDERLLQEERKSAGFKGRKEAGAVSRISMGRRRCGSDVGQSRCVW
jgi:hypothetical protein